MTKRSDEPVTPAQRELILYWRKLAADAGAPCPMRSAVNPWLLGRALANVSLLEVGADGRAVFRLAGSSITHLVGQAMRGVAVDTLDGPFAGLWRLGVSETLKTGQPVHGGVEGAIDGRDLAWLRLPLRNEDGERSLVLCHDAWRKSDASVIRPEVVFIPGGNPPIAA